MVGTTGASEIEMPGPGFPGTVASLSDAAWPGGKQPMRLRYWPQLRFGLANRTLLGCWKTVVLHDTVNGWPGACVNLAKNADVAPRAEACRAFCVNEAEVSPLWAHGDQMKYLMVYCE